MAARLMTVRTVRALRKRMATWRSRKLTVALVPTMGALHEGHLALVRLAKSRAKRVVVSIFVNPTQFAPHEDFAAYPRNEAGDRKLLAATGTDLIFAPPLEAMYAPGFATRVQAGGVAEVLEGNSRPHFFGGVATIVSKLLLQCGPDLAIFGEKDYQQLKVIEQLVCDLDIPVEIVAGPIVREPDGLAMSSRNAYLTPEERVVAPVLFRSLSDIASDIAEGRSQNEALAAGRMRLEAAGFAVNYLALRNATDLTPVAEGSSDPARVLAAVYLGRTRLIDNVPVPRRRQPGKRKRLTKGPAR